MPDPIGRRWWAIAEGYIPSSSHGPEPQMTSHETACVLNPDVEDAHVAITVFFADREPAGPYRVTVPARPAHPLQPAGRSRTDPEGYRLRPRARAGCAGGGPAGWMRAKPNLP